MPPLQLTIPCELDKAYSVMIVDDGRVAYAYLMQYEDAIADVWLYNLQKAPETLISNPEGLPELNPAGYLKKGVTVKPIDSLADVRCEWTEDNDGMIEVDILLHGNFVAQLIPGAKPGWSVLVAKDGPLALVY